jgi:hypothetical protein
VAHNRPQSDEALRVCAVAAHRSYLDALVAWERALHAISCAVCRPLGASTENLIQIAEQAEVVKERRRIAFRDLTAVLRYIPTGEGSALPEQEPGYACQACADPSARPS